MIESRPEATGASPKAIRAHYDVGNDFYRLWLEETMTYSSAMWRDENDTGSLADAQRRKIDWHLRHSGADTATTVLDIGCGWGATLRAAAQARAPDAPPLLRGVGLTLSDAQAELGRLLATQARLPQIEIRIEGWADHRPAEPYGAIISVGAFEHFTKPADASPTKIAIYREFFARCRDILAPEARMTLQTIAYGDPDDEVPAGPLVEDIFPESELPRLPEILAAANGLFEIELYRNDRRDYGRTCELWAANLKARRLEAVELVGKDQTRRYERYLKFAAWGFWSHRLHLLRFRLKRR
ncbi:MAG: class I SAM-dependent methyltransferase [Enhydrobacter sp.]|nr:class I SAM-dependent methyltransferase [Enhydrobacter sp.]